MRKKASTLVTFVGDILTAPVIPGDTGDAVDSMSKESFPVVASACIHIYIYLYKLLEGDVEL